MQTHIILSKVNLHWKQQSDLNSSPLWFKQNYYKHYLQYPYTVFQYSFQQNKITYLYLKATGQPFTILTDEFKYHAIEKSSS